MLDQFFESLDNSAEFAKMDEREFILSAIREVFGENLPEVTFEDYNPKEVN